MNDDSAVGMSINDILKALALHCVFYAWIVYAIEACVQAPRHGRHWRNGVIIGMTIMLAADAAMALEPKYSRKIVEITCLVLTVVFALNWLLVKKRISREHQSRH